MTLYIFKLEGKQFYRCVMGGVIVHGPVADNSVCPECKRIVNGSLATIVDVRKITHVTIDCSIGEIEILEDEFPGGLEQ